MYHLQGKNKSPSLKTWKQVIKSSSHNRYGSSSDRKAILKRSAFSSQPPATPLVRPASNGLSALGAVMDLGLSPAGWFSFAVLDSFRVFVRVVRRRRHPGVRIMYSPPYPRSGGASSTNGGRVELCVRRISWDLFGFCVRECGCRSVSFDLRFSSLAMVAALVR